MTSSKPPRSGASWSTEKTFLFFTMSAAVVLTAFNSGASFSSCDHPYAATEQNFVTPQQFLVPNATTTTTTTTTTTSAEAANPPPKNCSAALLLFGVPKNFSIIYEAYVQNLFVANAAQVDFTVYMHLYDDVQNLTNHKNNESAVVIQTEAEIRAILHRHKDYPAHVHTTLQRDFEPNLTWIHPNHTRALDRCCWTTDVIKNMFRQGNSILQVFHEAQEQKQHDLYIFARSDTFLAQPILFSCATVATNDLLIPSWQVKPDECNDRFALAGREAAEIYARAKGDAFARYLQTDPRVAETPIEPPRPKFMTNRNSEKMLCRWLKVDNKDKIVLREQEHDWANLLRIRGGGLVTERDESHFPASVEIYRWISSLVQRQYPSFR